MVQSEEYTKQQLDAAFFNLTKQRNLYEYGVDIINNTEIVVPIVLVIAFIVVLFKLLILFFLYYNTRKVLLQ